MRSQKLVDALNCNGAAYAAVQGSYPVLAWEAERSPATHAVRITQPEGGTIAADAGETVAFGTVLHLSNTPDIGWAFRTYTLDGRTLTGPYATVTADAAVSGVFSRMTAGALYIENAPAFSITVKKDGTVMENGTARRVTDYPVADGDPLYEGDVLTATATLAEGAEPEDLSYVYNGKFRYYFTFQDAAQTEKSTDTGKFTVTSRITSASLRLHATAYTTHKVWTQLAETDWYTPSADRFTLTSARQLAGLAQLVKQGNSFAGKTVLLGADISLANDDKTFNRSVRWFDGIGSTQAPFAGTFDGNGYRITEMTAESTGSGAALFLAADGAVLKNIRVSGTAKANGSAAGIAAQAKNTQFLGCVNEAAVTSTGEKAGGIAALLDGASSLTGCTNLGAVTGTDGVGGLAGVVNDKESTLTGCVNRGAVTGNGAATGIGGVAGRIGGSLLRCANYGAVTGSGWYLGGVAGACMTEGASSLTDCYSAGEVRNAHTYASSGTGGLIGYGNDYRAENCFSYGAVSAAAGTAAVRQTCVKISITVRIPAVPPSAARRRHPARRRARRRNLPGCPSCGSWTKTAASCWKTEPIRSFPPLRAAPIWRRSCATPARPPARRRVTPATRSVRPAARRSRTARSSRPRDIGTATARAQCAARRTRAGPERNGRGTTRSATSARATGSISV